MVCYSSLDCMPISVKQNMTIYCEIGVEISCKGTENSSPEARYCETQRIGSEMQSLELAEMNGCYIYETIMVSFSSCHSRL